LPLFASFVLSCTPDNVEEALPTEPVEKGAPFQMTVVFSPGQLGDKGYADNVMMGIGKLDNLNEETGRDTLDVRFVSTFNSFDSRDVLKSWAQTPTNPFYYSSYGRRLLVLTEYYMIEWLNDIKDFLRPEDEVLLLKVNSDDVSQAAATYGLGNRIHGLNISAAEPIRRYCAYMKWAVEIQSYFGLIDNIDVLPVYRLYDENMVTYRDSIAETITEELDTLTEIRTRSIMEKGDDAEFSVLYSSYLLQWSYQFAQDMHQLYDEQGYAFSIIDMGTGNAGWNYYTMGQQEVFSFYETLVLDADETMTTNNRIISRHFDEALNTWVREWMAQPTAAMPQIREYTGGALCYDNIPSLDL